MILLAAELGPGERRISRQDSGWWKMALIYEDQKWLEDDNRNANWG